MDGPPPRTYALFAKTEQFLEQSSPSSFATGVQFFRFRNQEDNFGHKN